MRNRPVPPPYETVTELVRAFAPEFRTRGQEILVKPCPVGGCKGDKFAIHAETGAWNCPKCGNRGNAWQLAKILGLAPVVTRPPERQRAKRVPQSEVDRRHAVDRAGLERIADYLAGRGLTLDAARAFGIGSRLDHEGRVMVAMPYFRADGHPARIKYRLIGEKHRMMWWPSKECMPLPEETPLFGRVDPTQPVTLVEGEFDALALHQVGIGNVASVANGAGSWDASWSLLLASAETIYCAFDDDESGNKAAAELRHRFGAEKVWRVTFPPHKDANDALKAGWDAERFEDRITAARSDPPEILIHGRTFALKRAEDLVSGRVPEPVSTGDAEFDHLEGGFRLGELSVLTGHSGEGKTTWATSLALRMAQRGESVGIYSFEQGVEATTDQLLMMLLNCAVMDAPPDSVRDAAERFPESLWLGAEPESQRVSTVVAAMRYGRVVYGTKFVVVDHLDFLLETSPSVTRYEAATNAVRALHRAAIESQVHVLLICQPTTDSGRSRTKRRKQLQIEDIAETRAARQLAHNGFVFESDRQSGTGSLYVAKARYGPAKDDVTVHYAFDGFGYREVGYSKGRPSQEKTYATDYEGGF